MSNVVRMFVVDMGASGGKCFAGVFEDGRFSMEEVHRFSHEGVSFYLPEASGELTERTYWDDTHIYANMLAGLHAYRRDVSDQLDSIGIDTWGADGQLVDANGDVRGKVYAYRDHRLDGMIDEIKSRVDAERLYAITGIHFQPFNMSNQLRWLVTRRPEAVAAGGQFLPIPTLLNYYLCGARQVDSTWASVTQLMSASDREWSDEVLGQLEIPRTLLPEIVDPGTVLGALSAPLAAAIGLNEAKVIAVGAHDTAGAYAAAPVDNTDEALIISSGTWSLVGKLLPQPITTPEAMAFNISNEGGIGNTRFLKNCMGTWLVQELIRIWQIADGRKSEWSELDPATEAAPPFVALIDPDDPSFFNPADMQEAIRDFCTRTGQTAPTERGSLLRTVYESLALKYRLVNEQLGKVSGLESKVVHIVGGGSNNILLNQFTADALGLPVLAGPKEATAVGNFVVQAMAMGVIKTPTDALPMIKEAFPIKTYTPQDTSAWDAAYARFKTLSS